MLSAHVAQNVAKFSSPVYGKDGFELSEPNAIVKYLANDFTQTSEIDYEEEILHVLLNSGKSDESILTKSPATKLEKLTASSIILFASTFALNKSAFPEFQKNEHVLKGLEQAIAVTNLERPKAEHTGTAAYKQGFEVKEQGKNILPKEGERNILITSALPYVNNVPHLGNIIGSVLSADFYSRYAKSRNYNALYICGTDEYGTATETKALEEGVTPRELCNKYHKIHSDVYKWFQIEFDHFGRTTTQQQTDIAQDIFLKLNENGYLEEQSMRQLYCPVHKGFLADRFVEGECPKCGYEDARGDQCDKCGALLDPFELVKPRCKLDNASPEERTSNHVFLSLDKLEPETRAWFEGAAKKGDWSKNGVAITQNWLNEGLNARCITRDLKWGTPVPLEKFADKVLYVWFDACIGYVSITANYTEDWAKWWKEPENVELYQFMGKDNVPFHTVIFPSSQIGTREKWTQLHHLSTSEYLQYEGGKFSKSRGIGVFGNNAQDSGISPSVWRYYLASVRPETSDSQFSWDDFASRNNNELLANLGNFVNRIVKFVNAKYNGVIPKYDPKNIPGYDALVKDLNSLLKSYNTEMEAVHERRGLELAMAISARGNQFLQDNKLDNSLYNDLPDKSDAVVGVGLNIVYLVASVIAPFMPETTKQIDEMLNVPQLAIPDEFTLILEGTHNINKAQYLFKRIEGKDIEALRAKYGEIISQAKSYLKNVPVTVISQGAEAVVFTTSQHPYLPKEIAPKGIKHKDQYIIKFRPPKKYRHPILDAQLTKRRTLAEARILQRLTIIPEVHTPSLLAVDPRSGILWMECIGELLPDGKLSSLKNWLWQYNGDEEKATRDEAKTILEGVGKEIGYLHLNDLIHGDLTSSNIVLQKGIESGDWEAFLIDFGLGSVSTLVEDKAVDLYVLERAILSTHPLYSDHYNKWLLDGYSSVYTGKQNAKKLKEVLNRYEDVRMRGRKRSMLG
ncbi:methionyl-tRNA synthetase [Wickerhamomyces ciferrii]|uniref:EKC/KEOPS complex subunit BUD32 n=1 Tax=Wickerhamomyces ciferrii (strain ATCC 14091 / BCRC 22168 / CBS 111 / JCM 3599 / NBRC 0793 / NRRL Y-1031 F-60-10) TaxID=1206466 RepID=K0KGG6_WICCF|nr:methionyl-tRNA synthetase [Wickerhamomyces ciferrii]CCH44255.1 methionyl-tRNA synthetase [Wickerhamomyces ciferrii]